MNQDTKKPANLRANAMPIDGYVLSVDGKLKTRYDSSKDAIAAKAQQLPQRRWSRIGVTLSKSGQLKEVSPAEQNDCC